MMEVRLQCCAQSCDRAHQKTDMGLRGLQSPAERVLCSSIHSKANRASVGCRHVGELPLVCLSCLPVCAHEWSLPVCAHVWSLPVCAHVWSLPVCAHVWSLPVCAPVWSLPVCSYVEEIYLPACFGGVKRGKMCVARKSNQLHDCAYFLSETHVCHFLRGHAYIRMYMGAYAHCVV